MRADQRVVAGIRSKRTRVGTVDRFHGDWDEARRIHNQYLPLFRANFLTTNPVPVKAALAAMGLVEEVLRQPLLPIIDPQRSQLMDVLREAGLVVPVAGVAR